MTRSTRMFEIIQILRTANQPRTARQLAGELEVTKRTVYRDIAALQAMRVPVEGAAGLGYVMRSGYDLPPVNFDVEEAEAVTVGLALIARTGDKGLTRAAKSAAQKLATAAKLNGAGLSETVYASTWGVEAPEGVDLSAVRQAIREEQKMRIVYKNADDEQTQRVIWPIAIAYHSEVIVLAAWCELRQAIRHFRPDRISAAQTLDDRFAGAGDKLRQEWIKGYADRL